jgi:pimeloyl-ACP methyl ester carboxylesterase
MNTRNMTTIDVDGVAVAYREAGAGDPVILLHGWGGSAASMQPVFECLRTHNRVVALDFPGFGASALPPVPWGVGDYAVCLRRLLDRLEIEKSTLIGHSFGGRVAIVYATTWPEQVDRLILVDSAGIRPATTPRQQAIGLAARAGKAVLGLPGLKGLRASARAAATARLGSEDYQQAGPLRKTFVRVVGEDLRPRLPRIQAPTLLVWGSNDDATPLADAKIMEKEIPDAGLVVFEGAGHFSYVDRPADFCRIATTFLASPAR